MAAPLRFIPALTPEQLAALARMAREIWYEYYVSLIGRAQVDYMVERFQSVPAMQAQLAEGYEYYLIERGTAPEPICLGYLAMQPDMGERTLFLSKLYVIASARGTGAGREALTFVEAVARERGLERVWLTVHKRNPSRSLYERLGYATTADIVMDIGAGFVMDDFRMEKIVA